MTSRRKFLQHGAAAAAAAALPRSVASPEASSDSSGSAARVRPKRAYLDILRQPDIIVARTAAGVLALRSAAGGKWRDDAGRLTVTVTEQSRALRVQLEAPSTAVMGLHLRWRGAIAVSSSPLLLGDAWERAYGDVEWRGIVPDRPMPWYFAISDERVTDAFGVRTGAGAFCWWQADPRGISLHADVRSGGVGVRLGERTLDVCEVLSRAGVAGETAFAALHAFCREMCPAPRLPTYPVYGSNDWYWAYGKNSADSVMTDARHIVELSPPGANRPFAVIDDGWQPERGSAKQGVGLWDRGNEKFPEMPVLAARIRAAGARPGIWIRPLLAPADVPDGWRLTRERTVLDPTVPEVLQKVHADVSRVRAWGYELVKHDYTTFDVLGRWGPQLGTSLTKDGWTFAAGPTRTTAEVLDELYRTIRDAAGEGLVIGCNTVSHLSAGRFEICRIGDDTSGREWARVPRMGVNALAFRGLQHGAFYVADPDCVGVTNDIPWSFNRQWLDLLARSGTMLFVSLAPDALGTVQRRDLRDALALAARPRPLGEPLDWQHESWPSRWRLDGEERSYDWVGDDGVPPVA